MWLYSGPIYYLFNKGVSYFKKNIFHKWFQKESNTYSYLKILRKTNNILLALFSGYMTVFSSYEIYNQLENYSVDEIVCKEYELTENLYNIGWMFYLSKYWEWLDTFFLIMFDKKVTNLHYYHHSSTPFLSYVNTFYQGFSPSYIYAVFWNCLVHTFMYWYYAYPRGVLYKYKKIITQIQIVQHIYMILSTIYIYNYCDWILVKYTVPYYSSVVCYSYYLFKFVMFYFVTYIGQYKNTISSF